ncbi:hypothetical protein IscW_ISCW011229 [Ixodes scapularis]|uniref:Uncharacterized protein n=1 Tax=Ixodes scapularis TaxID=6945 RepID=B7Q8D9_IXOSC|nr:hypothetical protein IscW_ISCW011229 [Ixodes scapularis]|eukprot:XP_002412348.1 hypothetical protein IscW_ISCW011229 [Ixodes scapularis]
MKNIATSATSMTFVFIQKYHQLLTQAPGQGRLVRHQAFQAFFQYLLWHLLRCSHLLFVWFPPQSLYLGRFLPQRLYTPRFLSPYQRRLSLTRCLTLYELGA